MGFELNIYIFLIKTWSIALQIVHESLELLDLVPTIERLSLIIFQACDHRLSGIQDRVIKIDFEQF